MGMNIDFDELCVRGINGDRDLYMQELLDGLVDMDKWYLLVEKILDDNIRPVVGEVDDKLWVFGFTDARRARKFTREKNVNADIIEMNPVVCIPWLKEYKRFGIVGVRFNEGKLGWYISIKNLEYVMKIKVN